MILSPKGFAGQFVLLCWAAWSVFWIVSAFFVKRTVERRFGIWRGFIVLAVFGLLALLRRSGAIPASALGYSRAPAVGILADVLTFAGLTVTLWSRAALGSNWSGTVAFKENHELVERGPYRFVRHPIYSGILLMVLGTALISGTVSGFALFVLCCLGLWLKARQEERLLARHFPAYSSYKARVRAVIPFLL
jgi:protein-S-isoprenylcysteine O-methyltransferase Ste14